MKKLTNEEMKNINGGVALKANLFLLGGVITFIVGLIDGFTNPLRCN